MKRTVATIVAVAVFGLGAPHLQARKDRTHKPGTTQTSAMSGRTESDPVSAQNQERAKHVGTVDVALATALLNAHLLTTIAGMPEGKMDQAIIAEASKNLDRSIASAIEHVGHVKMMKKDKTAGTPTELPGSATDTAGEVQRVGGHEDAWAHLEELESHLEEAKLAAKKLKGVKKLEKLSGTIGPVTTHLTGANDALDTISDTWGVARIDAGLSERHPVGGSGLGDEHVGPDVGSEKPVPDTGGDTVNPDTPANEGGIAPVPHQNKSKPQSGQKR